jgi:TPR repeat protein|tara:strand:- start:1152 stop:1385 length:234 start_codon:yes stop_codon:yes gene_type:complete
MKSLWITPLVLLALLAPLNAGADSDKGVAASQAGDWATAEKEWKKAAEQGNVTAQFNLGIMYDSGRGVVKDDQEAVE